MASAIVTGLDGKGVLINTAFVDGQRVDVQFDQQPLLKNLIVKEAHFLGGAVYYDLRVPMFEDGVEMEDMWTQMHMIRSIFIQPTSTTA
jgi:hypothetical protein